MPSLLWSAGHGDTDCVRIIILSSAFVCMEFETMAAGSTLPQPLMRNLCYFVVTLSHHITFVSEPYNDGNNKYHKIQMDDASRDIANSIYTHRSLSAEAPDLPSAWFNWPLCRHSTNACRARYVSDRANSEYMSRQFGNPINSPRVHIYLTTSVASLTVRMTECANMLPCLSICLSKSKLPVFPFFERIRVAAHIHCQLGSTLLL